MLEISPTQINLKQNSNESVKSHGCKHKVAVNLSDKVLPSRIPIFTWLLLLSSPLQQNKNLSVYYFLFYHQTDTVFFLSYLC